MQGLSPWATKADVDAAREELKADIAALHANLTAMHGDLRAVQALLTEQNKRRPWRRRLFAAGVALMAVMAASTGARSQVMDGNKLYDNCSSSRPEANLFCRAYVAGIYDATLEQGYIGVKVCAAEGVTVGELEDLVSQYLAAHSAERHLSGASLVTRALAEAYPCR